MATNRYTVATGMLLAEKRGVTRKCCRTDALGCTVSLYDNSQAKTDTFTYWPYGEDRVVSNPTGTKYEFVGGYQCRTQNDGGIYMRARVEEPRDGRFITVDPLWPNQPAFQYGLDSPQVNIDPFGTDPPSDPCKPGGLDRHHPPDCSKCGPGCKAVYLTCNPNATGRTAVYCLPDAICTDSKGHNIRCCDLCNQQGEPLGVPVFPRGTTVCVHGIHGNQTRKINDCGCGQKKKNKPIPDNWMDIEIEGGCSKFKDGWRCVCPGGCKK